MTNQTFRQFDIQHHQKDWPVDRVETQNVLAHHVEDCSVPEFVKVPVLILTVAKSCHIVEQGIKPNINNVFRIWWDWYSPCKGCTRYGQIFQTWLNEVFQHFIESTIRCDKVWLRFEKFYQAVLVLAETEEVRLFRYPLHFMSRWRNSARYIPSFVTENFRQLAFSEEFLIRYRIPAWIFS